MEVHIWIQKANDSQENLMFQGTTRFAEDDTNRKEVMNRMMEVKSKGARWIDEEFLELRKRRNQFLADVKSEARDSFGRRRAVLILVEDFDNGKDTDELRGIISDAMEISGAIVRDEDINNIVEKISEKAYLKKKIAIISVIVITIVIATAILYFKNSQNGNSLEILKL